MDLWSLSVWTVRVGVGIKRSREADHVALRSHDERPQSESRVHLGDKYVDASPCILAAPLAPAEVSLCCILVLKETLALPVSQRSK